MRRLLLPVWAVGAFFLGCETAPGDSGCPGGECSDDCGGDEYRVRGQCRTLTACSPAQYQLIAPTESSDRVCAALTTCRATQYERKAPTATSDRECKPLTECRHSQYESTAPTARSDRECTALTECARDEFEAKAPTDTSDRECHKITDCDDGSYEVKAPTATSDRVCEPVSACPAGSYTAAPGWCRPLTECKSNEYESQAPTGHSDRVCTRVTECTGAQEEVAPPTATSDRVCAEVGPCGYGFYESEPATATRPPECKPVTVCTASQYETRAPTATTNRVCAPLSVCRSGEVELVAPTPTSDRVCVGECTVTPPPSQCCKRYRVSAPLLDGQPSECSGDVYYADESQPSYGFHWNDFGAGGVTSASLRLNPGVSCDVSGTRTPLFNDAATTPATFTLPEIDQCTCTPLDLGEVTLELPLASYVVAGRNQLSITGATNFEGLQWLEDTNAFSVIDVCYDEVPPPTGLCENVVCAPLGECQLEGACNPASGECEYRPKTQCDDGDPDTSDDRCTSDGDCVGCLDRDGDTYGSNCDAGPDCDDERRTVNPGIDEVCQNGLDDDCAQETSDSDCVPNPCPSGNCGPGCADGTREGYTDAELYPAIAACSGGWSVPGVFQEYFAQCDREAGNDSTNPEGTDCTASDLCAPGWHVCRTAREINTFSGGDGCTPVTLANSFFVSGQSGNGCGYCSVSSDPNDAGCTGGSCLSMCYPTSIQANDIFGCGTIGITPAANCAPLNRFGNNLCSSLPSPWTCSAGSNSFDESMWVTKGSSESGGVLCCVD